MRYHSDPTADRALGALNREWNQMVKLAVRVRESTDVAWAEAQRRRFTGIYERLLTDPLESLKKTHS